MQQAEGLGVAGHRHPRHDLGPDADADRILMPMRCARVPSAVVTATILSSISWFIRSSPYRRSLGPHHKGAMGPAGVWKVAPEVTRPHA